MRSLFERKQTFFESGKNLHVIGNLAVGENKRHYKTALSLNSTNFLATFSLQAGGAKKKLSKRNAKRRISPSAEGDKGSAPLTAQAFEKA